jgi:single-strand DNA-binding protein
MASMNRVFLLGNLTRDPEVRYLPSGQAVADIRLAVSRKFKTANGQEREETCYVDVVVWGRSAEACGKFLNKGSPLLVEGRLQYDEWEKDGKKNSRLRVVADRTQFVGAPRRAEYSDQAAEESPAPAGKPAARVPSEGEAGETPAPGSGDADDLPF